MQDSPVAPVGPVAPVDPAPPPAIVEKLKFPLKVKEVVKDKEVVKPVQTRAEKVAAAPTTYASFKEAAKVLSPKAVEKFTADGSGLSAKEVSSLKKEFPALAEVFETAKKPKKK